MSGHNTVGDKSNSGTFVVYTRPRPQLVPYTSINMRLANWTGTYWAYGKCAHCTFCGCATVIHGMMKDFKHVILSKSATVHDRARRCVLMRTLIPHNIR